LSTIRLHYSTFVNFASMIYRMLTSVGFLVIIARRLSTEEFGLWGIIFSIVAMLLMPTSLWTMWLQRFYARGYREALGTALFFSIVYSFISLLVYVMLAYFENSILSWGLDYMLLGSFILLLRIFDTCFSSVANVTKPEIVGYKNFIYETLRLSLTYFFVILLNMKLSGAIISVELSLAIGLLYTITMLYRNGLLMIKFSQNLAIQWLKSFYIPLLNTFLGILRNGLRAFVSWITASEVTIAYLNVGFASESPLIRAYYSVVPALYARSLRRPRSEDLEESLRLFFLFSGFLLVNFTVLSKTIASMFNPTYIKAFFLIPLVAFYAVILGLMNIFNTFILGSSRADVEGLKSHKELIKSHLFKLPTVKLLGLLFTYVLLLMFLPLVRGDHLLEAMVAVITLFVGNIVIFPYFSYELNKMTRYNFPWNELFHVSIASVTAGLYYIFSGAYTIEIRSFWKDAPQLGFHVAVATILYILTLYMTSKWFRSLVWRAISYIIEER